MSMILPISHNAGLRQETSHECRSIEPLGSELWLFKEGTYQICLKIEAFLTLFVNQLKPSLDKICNQEHFWNHQTKNHLSRASEVNKECSKTLTTVVENKQHGLLWIAFEIFQRDHNHKRGLVDLPRARVPLLF